MPERNCDQRWRLDDASSASLEESKASRRDSRNHSRTFQEYLWRRVCGRRSRVVPRHWLHVRPLPTTPQSLWLTQCRSLSQVRRSSKPKEQSPHLNWICSRLDNIAQKCWLCSNSFCRYYAGWNYPQVILEFQGRPRAELVPRDIQPPQWTPWSFPGIWLGLRQLALKEPAHSERAVNQASGGSGQRWL